MTLMSKTLRTAENIAHFGPSAMILLRAVEPFNFSSVRPRGGGAKTVAAAAMAR